MSSYSSDYTELQQSILSTKSEDDQPKSWNSSGKSRRSSYSNSAMSSKKQRHTPRPISCSESDGKLPNEALSVGEMRTKLFSSFKSKGLLSNLKSQLRTNLASAIKETEHLPSTKKTDGSNDSITGTITDYIVAEHLQRANYEYSLSVFRTESQSANLKFGVKDILKFMRIDPNSEIYQNLVDSDRTSHSKSFLLDLLSAAFSSERLLKVSTETQTVEFNEICSGSIERKMMEIEENIFNKGMKELESESSTLEARLFEFQKKIELQKRSELTAELKAFREKELAEMRLYEREERRKEVERMRVEMERSYQKLQKKLQEREKESEELMRMKKRSLEQEAFQNRQQMLSDIEVLKERENEMKRSHELAMQSLSLEQTKAKAFAAELKAKELSLKSVEERYENKLKEEILRIKLEKQEEEQNHQQYIRTEQTKLEVEKRSFEAQKLLLTKNNDEFERTKSENAQLQISLDTAMKKVSELTQKSDYLNDRLRELSDYHQIKEKSIILSKEFEISKLKLKESHDENESCRQKHNKKVNDLMEKLNKTPIDKSAVHKKLEKERLEFNEKEKLLNEKCNILEKKLHSEILKNKELNSLYDEKILQQKAMFREIEELKNSLRKMQSSRQIQTQTISTSRASTLWRSSELPAMTSTWQSKMPGHSKLSESFFSRSPKSIEKSSIIPEEITQNKQLGITFVRESRDVFEKLEREAAELEKSYRNYQQKLRSQEQLPNGKPNTNDYIVLEKYHSTIFPPSGDFIPINKVDSCTADMATARMHSVVENEGIALPRKGFADIQTVSRSQQGKLNITEAPKDTYLNSAPTKALVDTWTGDYLTEQLLASAVNEHDDDLHGNYFQGTQNKPVRHNERRFHDEVGVVQNLSEVPEDAAKKYRLSVDNSNPDVNRFGSDASIYKPLSDKTKNESHFERPNINRPVLDTIKESSPHFLPEQDKEHNDDFKSGQYGNSKKSFDDVSGEYETDAKNHLDTISSPFERKKGESEFRVNDRETINASSRIVLREKNEPSNTGRHEIAQSVIINKEGDNKLSSKSIEAKIRYEEDEREEQQTGFLEDTQYVEHFDIYEENGPKSSQTFTGIVDSKQHLDANAIEETEGRHSMSESDTGETESLRREESRHSLEAVEDASQSFVKKVAERFETEANKRKEQEERLLAFEKERKELERLEREEHERATGSLSPLNSNSISSKSEEEKERENSLNHDKPLKAAEIQLEGEETKKDDEIKIDPLMQHYMQMIMNKRQQENAEATNIEDEKEDLNMTDDYKLESKISNKSDITDLLEDQIENIEDHSDDDFDW